MPVLFQLFQTSSFALPFGSRYRHVAFGLRGTGHRSLFTGEYTKGYPGQSQRQSEHRTKIHESAFKSPSSRSQEAATSEGAIAGICGASGGFLFHYWNLGLCEMQFLRSRDAIGLALRGVNALDSRDLKMQERP